MDSLTGALKMRIVQSTYVPTTDHYSATQIATTWSLQTPAKSTESSPITIGATVSRTFGLTGTTILDCGADCMRFGVSPKRYFSSESTVELIEPSTQSNC